MEFIQLVVFVALVRLRLGEARFVGSRESTREEAEVEAEPERKTSRLSSVGVDLLGEKVKGRQQEVTPLPSRFPQAPVETVIKPPLSFTMRQSSTTNRVAVRCGQSRVQVEVSQDLLGLGRLINPKQIKLGGCSAVDVDHLSHVIVFESELHACGSKLLMTENSFIYVFALVYNPEVLTSSRIICSQSVVTVVQCHYPR